MQTQEVSLSEKLITLNCIIFNYCCTPSMFWENVGSNKSQVMKQIKEAKTEKDVRNIVNQYI